MTPTFGRLHFFEFFVSRYRDKSRTSALASLKRSLVLSLLKLSCFSEPQSYPIKDFNFLVFVVVCFCSLLNLKKEKNSVHFNLVLLKVGAVLVAMSVQGQDAVGPFFLDLMPTILETLNSGNKVIYGHIDEAMRQVFLHLRTFFVRGILDKISFLVR